MGLEPTTSAVTGRRSNQLSHRAISIRYYTLKTEPESLIYQHVFVSVCVNLFHFMGRIYDSSNDNHEVIFV